MAKRKLYVGVLGVLEGIDSETTRIIANVAGIKPKRTVRRKKPTVSKQKVENAKIRAAVRREVSKYRRTSVSKYRRR